MVEIVKNLNLSESEKEQLSKDVFAIVQRCEQAHQCDLFFKAIMMLAQQYIPEGSQINVDIILPGKISSSPINFNFKDGKE